MASIPKKKDALSLTSGSSVRSGVVGSRCVGERWVGDESDWIFSGCKLSGAGVCGSSALGLPGSCGCNTCLPS